MGLEAKALGQAPTKLLEVERALEIVPGSARRHDVEAVLAA
jgi:hypothetical protein